MFFKFSFEDEDRDDANDIFRAARSIILCALAGAVIYLTIVFVFSF